MTGTPLVCPKNLYMEKVGEEKTTGVLGASCDPEQTSRINNSISSSDPAPATTCSGATPDEGEC